MLTRGRIASLVGLMLAVATPSQQMFGAQTHRQAPTNISSGTSAGIRITDLTRNTSERGAIESMVAQGIVKLTGPNTFSPAVPVRRGELVVSLQHMFGLGVPQQRRAYPDVPPNNEIYSAVVGVAPYLADQMLCAVCALPGNFLADEPVSRGLAAATLVGILSDHKKITLTAAPDQVLAPAADAGLLGPEARIYLATALTSGILTLDPGNRIDASAPMSRVELAAMLDSAQRKFGISAVKPTAISPK
jgi:hypothetical protein